MLEKIHNFLSSEHFLKYALLSSLVLAFAALATTFYFAARVQNLTKAVLAHEQILINLTTGKMPILKIDEQSVPFAGFIYNEVNELKKRVKVLEPETSPTPAPSRFDLPK